MKLYYSVFLLIFTFLTSCSEYVYVRYNAPDNSELYLSTGEPHYINDTLFFDDEILYLGKGKGERPLHKLSKYKYIDNGKLTIVAPDHIVNVTDVVYNKKGSTIDITSIELGEKMKKRPDNHLQIKVSDTRFLGLENLSSSNKETIEDEFSHYNQKKTNQLNAGKANMEEYFSGMLHAYFKTKSYTPTQKINMGNTMDIAYLESEINLKKIERVNYGYFSRVKLFYDIKLELTDVLGNVIYGEERTFDDFNFDVESNLLKMLGKMIADKGFERSKSLIHDNYERQLMNWKILPINNPSAQKSVSEACKAVISVETEAGLGSGVVISQDGYILTNHHVIVASDSIAIHTSEGDTLKGFLVRSNPKYDLALIKVEHTFEHALPVKKQLSSIKSYLNASVYVIGTPLERALEQSVSKGVITGYRSFGEVQAIQTNAAINPGNSGGALLNDKRELIGIVNAKMIGFGVKKMGYAIPSNLIENALKISL